MSFDKIRAKIMQTTVLRIRDNPDLQNAYCPLPISVIPNNMGINLCSVDSIEWHKQPDGQLTYLKINFIPNNEES